ncbi:MAG TPA: hypothetical protein VFK59_11595 [Actinomycetota bacterium]|nr:hypothetical protein [Actinomycetota bacterium]
MVLITMGFATPASAVPTGTIAVCVTDSAGVNVVLGGDQAWYKIGGTSYYVGPVGLSGCRESTLAGGTSVEVWAAKNGTYSHHQTGTVPSDGSTLRFDFYTTRVTLQYSKNLAFGGSNGDSAWFAKPSMELLSDGVTPVRFRLDQTGGASGRMGLLWPVATGTGATFTRSLIALRLVDSTGAPLNGGTARYQYGSWYYAPGSTGNEPSAPGILAYAIPGLAGTVTNEMRFNNTTQTVTQDASINSVYQFQTRKLTLRLETCSGTPLNGGKPRYGLGATYTTWWFPGGVTGTSAAGETAAQVFPGTYSFEMQYKGTADPKLSVVIPNADTLLTWQTTNVTLSYSGAISYGGPAGDSAWFTKPSMELLPGTYKFHFREASGPGVTVDLTFGGCSFAKSMVIAHLLDHSGTGIPGGAVDYAPGGSWLPFGTTNANGVAYLLANGPLGNIQVRMTYHQGSQIQLFSQPTHSVFTFQTVQATISLQDHLGSGLAGGSVSQGGGYWDPVGTTDGSGNVFWEMFPGTYKFKMTYHAGAQELTQSIATPVVFQTGAVHSDSGTATQYAQGSWQPFVQDVELLPGSWHFSFNDGNPVTYYTIVGGVVNHIH